MILFIMAALVVGFFLGGFATYKNFVLPTQESEAGLRKELGEVRTLLWNRECALEAFQAAPWTDLRWLGEKHSVAHFDLTDPKIERREHSDVLFIQVEDLLR